MNEYYNYQETLDIVEKFMVDSGIREYCETICKGKCCRDCYGSPNACFKNEGRRLSCSCYICLEMAQEVFGDEYHSEDEIGILSSKITNILCGIMYSNPFYNVHTPDIQKDFKVLIDDVKHLENLKIEDIKETMNSLIENKIQVRE